MCTFLGQPWPLKLSYIERCILDCCVGFNFFGWWTVNPRVIWVASNNVSLPCGTKLEESVMNSQSIKRSVVVFFFKSCHPNPLSQVQHNQLWAKVHYMQCSNEVKVCNDEHVKVVTFVLVRNSHIHQICSSTRNFVSVDLTISSKFWWCDKLLKWRSIMSATI
jgi:hypothetical protein